MIYTVPARFPQGRYTVLNHVPDRRRLRLRRTLGQWEGAVFDLGGDAVWDVGSFSLEPVASALPDWATGAGYSFFEPALSALPEWATADVSYSFFEAPTWSALDLPSWISEAPTLIPELPSLAELTLPGPTAFPPAPLVPTSPQMPTWGQLFAEPAPTQLPGVSTFSWASFWKGLPQVLTAGGALAGAGAAILRAVEGQPEPVPSGARAYLGPTAAGQVARYPAPAPGLYPPGTIPPTGAYRPLPFGVPPPAGARPGPGVLSALQQPIAGVPVWAWLGGGALVLWTTTGVVRRRRRRRAEKSAR